MKKRAVPVFFTGMKDGLPIGLGYFAVAFALGITAKDVGMTAWQGFVFSLFGVASAGEYAAITVMAAGASYIEMAVVTLVTNARYLLMSAALSQRLSEKTGIGKRLLLGYAVTDELFGIAIAQPEPLDPMYCYGSYIVAPPLWALGTMLGIIAGNNLPVRVVSALSVALFGMFIAIVIPPSRKSKVIAGLVALSFAASLACQYIPWICTLTAGTRTIILTIILSVGASLLFPVKDEEEAKEAEADA